MFRLHGRHIFAIAVIATVVGRHDMAESQEPTEIDRLFRTLNAENVKPDDLEAGLPGFSASSKNDVVTRVARTFEPAPSGKLLARLPFILTADNRADMTAAFILNLRSPDPSARRFSLYGLEKLSHPALADFALQALRDTDDQVLYAASFILFPKASKDARLWGVLQGVYEARKERPEFYTTVNYLRAQGIEKRPPAPE